MRLKEILIFGDFDEGTFSAAGARASALAEGFALHEFRVSGISFGVEGSEKSATRRFGPVIISEHCSRFFYHQRVFTIGRGQLRSRRFLWKLFHFLMRMIPVFWLAVSWIFSHPKGVILLYGSLAPMLAPIAFCGRVMGRTVVLDVTEWRTRGAGQGLLENFMRLGHQELLPLLVTHATFISDSIRSKLPIRLTKILIPGILSAEWKAVISSAPRQEPPYPTFAIVFSGSENQGLRPLVEAVAMLARKHRVLEFQLHLTGQSEIISGIPDESERDFSLIAHGFLEAESYAQVLKSANCLVIPGEADSDKRFAFPNRLPEYLLSGTPTVLAGYPNYHVASVRPSAFLKIEQASAEHLSSAIDWIIVNPKEAKIMGEMAIEYSKAEFNPRSTVGGLIKELP